MKLSCIRKKREEEFFKAISKDIRKTIAPSFMFLFIFIKKIKI